MQSKDMYIVYPNSYEIKTSEYTSAKFGAFWNNMIV